MREGQGWPTSRWASTRCRFTPAPSPIPATGARQTPIYQSTAYVFRDVDHAARLFNLQELGFIYSRLTNPTVMTLAERLTALEGGVGGVCTSSGHAAQIMALFPLMGPGDNIVSSNRLYGGTVTQFTHTIRRFGWSARFVDTDDLAAVEAAVDGETKAIFCELIANPGGYVTDIPALAEVAKRVGVPLIVDNTSATPWLCRPFEQGADIVVHSTTKFLTGNATVVGGALIDAGRFDWAASGKYPGLTEPEPAYHGLKFFETFGPMAYTFHSIAIGMRDLGMTMAPQNAFLTLLGTETLSLRMKKHVENAEIVAAWLEKDPAGRVRHLRRPAVVALVRPREAALPEGRRRALHLRAEGRLRCLHPHGEFGRAVQPRREPRRRPLADHPLGLDHPPPAHPRAAGGRRRHPERRPPVDRHRGPRRPDPRPRPGAGEGHRLTRLG